MNVSLLFYRGTGLASAVIRWWTRSPFAHVAPAIDAGADPNAESFIYDAFWKAGVTRRPWQMSDGLATRIDLPDVDPGFVRDWLDAQVGKKYDKASILLCGLCKRSPQWLHVYVSKQGEWDCSRLSCVVAMKVDRAWGLRWPVTPGDLYNITMADRLPGPKQ